MITTKELFHRRNIQLFLPGDGVEFIYSILQNTGHNDFKCEKVRNKGLKIIEKLFKLELIEVFHWGKYNDKLKNKNLSNSEIINYIERFWFIGADLPDFFSMPMFKFKDWYITKMKELGFTHFTDWESFVKNEIGDLEKWIEKNRPK